MEDQPCIEWWIFCLLHRLQHPDGLPEQESKPMMQQGKGERTRRTGSTCVHLCRQNRLKRASEPLYCGRVHPFFGNCRLLPFAA